MKLAHQCISSLTKDPNQVLSQLIRRITGSTPTSSAQKRYVPPSTDSTSDPYDEPPAAPPVTGSFTAPAYTSISTTLTVTAPAGNPARPLQKKSSNPHIGTSVGMVSIAGGAGTANTVVTASSDKNTTETKSSSVANLPPISRSSNPPLLSNPPSSAPILTRSSSAGSASTASSGAVRKLFVTPTVTQPAKQPTPRTSGPKAIQSRPNLKPALIQDPNTSSNTNPVLKCTSAQPVFPPTSSVASKTIFYSRIITSQEINRGGQHSEMIEQPVQQIMKTPTIFQEPATQITKPKKISTYSDAVGKKHQLTVSSSSNSSGFTGDIGGRIVSSGSSYPVTSSASSIPHPSLNQGSKINLAPGSRPVVGATVTTVDTDKVSGLFN